MNKLNKMQFKIEVDNIKCGGCANQITQKLTDLEGVSDVAVNVEQGQVSVETTEALLTMVKEKLASMGYPETGTEAGLDALGSKAKSYVSCAMGRMTDAKEKSEQ